MARFSRMASSLLDCINWSTEDSAVFSQLNNKVNIKSDRGLKISFMGALLE
jgi:hypothetical protein